MPPLDAAHVEDLPALVLQMLGYLHLQVGVPLSLGWPPIHRIGIVAHLGRRCPTPFRGLTSDQHQHVMLSGIIRCWNALWGLNGQVLILVVNYCGWTSLPALERGLGSLLDGGLIRRGQISCTAQLTADIKLYWNTIKSIRRALFRISYIIHWIILGRHV